MGGADGTVSSRLTADSCDPDAFHALVSTETRRADYPHADEVVDQTLIYDGADLARLDDDPLGRQQFFAELAHAFLDGPGIAVFRNAVSVEAIDAATPFFEQTIRDQKGEGADAGDHFATPGSNDRIWNTQEKLALAAPDVFAEYFTSAAIAYASEAWLGPGYQITAQVNVVNPGGAAQKPHRDYHLGFMTDDQATAFPPHVHRLSPVLTLQGAIAHCDMPVETGPTLYLPHSQKYLPGYLAWRRPDFQAYFEDHHVQLQLNKGDAVFFNPATFHAGGANTTSDVYRMANLLQVGSAFGRTMEAVDRTTMARALYPVLQSWQSSGRSAADIERVVAATAEGYAFPGNLDLDQPTEGLAPRSPAATMLLALREEWSAAELASALPSGSNAQ